MTSSSNQRAHGVVPRRIACVTGASGLVGARIAEALRKNGFHIRVLTRRESFADQRYEIFRGSLDDESSLKRFLDGGDVLFHCAAELRDESKMWDVNVAGTERLLRMSRGCGIASLCHLSSAGVVGRTTDRLVTETTPARPQNLYERSKWEGERIVRGEGPSRTIIVRPTNVIDDHAPGALALPLRRSISDWAKLVVKGAECAHIVHAIDVAAAATFLMSAAPVGELETYFVSCDDDPMNTVAELWRLCDAIRENRPVASVRPIPHLPVAVPYVLRSIVRRRGNRGDVRYSNAKLRAAGFEFLLGVEAAVRRLLDMARLRSSAGRGMVPGLS